MKTQSNRMHHPGVCALLLLGASAMAAIPVQADETGPLAQAVSEGKSLFTHHTFGGPGRTCESCHHAGGTGPTVLPNGLRKLSIASAATHFPRFNPKAGHILTLEDQVRRCVAGGLQGTPPAYDSTEMRSMIAYLTSLSQGKPINMGATPGK